MARISKRASGAWQNTSYGIRGTTTDTITTLPTTIYGDGTNATVSIKGNTTQPGTPTPDSPIMLQGCGELETVGAKVGQYKIPISSTNTTTPIYLGEVETTRKIKKLVLTGEEAWQLWYGNYYSSVIDRKGARSTILCTHFINSNAQGISYEAQSTSGLKIASVAVPFASSVNDLKAWFAAQYANGTPVCVWYVLATEETGIVNEPLMKIEDYADVVNNISIPTTDGANTLSVDTPVQPSEVSINYHGWHMGAVHERTAGQWD